ncbi:MAG: hypothetical protein ACYC1C_09275 [Chloroflexota bacterium]
MRLLETIDRLVRWDTLPLPGRADDAVVPVPQASPEPQPAQEAVTLVEEDRLWRAVTTSGQRELPWTQTQEQMLDATEAYRANPLAFRIVELTADHVLGKGLRLKCSDQAVQRWLDAWWGHPQNHMAPRCYELCRELSISGEVFVTYHKNPLDGMVYIRQIPPVNVDGVETDPEDLEREVRYHESGSTADVLGRWWGADECMRYKLSNGAICQFAPAGPGNGLIGPKGRVWRPYKGCIGSVSRPGAPVGPSCAVCKAANLAVNWPDLALTVLQNP